MQKMSNKLKIYEIRWESVEASGNNKLLRKSENSTKYIESMKIYELNQNLWKSMEPVEINKTYRQIKKNHSKQQRTRCIDAGYYDQIKIIGNERDTEQRN